MPTEAYSLPDAPQVPKALVRQFQGSPRAHDLLVQALPLQIARPKQLNFGACSKKIARETEQLEPTLEWPQMARIHDHSAPRFAELRPCNWKSLPDRDSPNRHSMTVCKPVPNGR